MIDCRLYSTRVRSVAAFLFGLGFWGNKKSVGDIVRAYPLIKASTPLLAPPLTPGSLCGSPRQCLSPSKVPQIEQIERHAHTQLGGLSGKGQRKKRRPRCPLTGSDSGGKTRHA